MSYKPTPSKDTADANGNPIGADSVKQNAGAINRTVRTNSDKRWQTYVEKRFRGIK